MGGRGDCAERDSSMESPLIRWNPWRLRHADRLNTATSRRSSDDSGNSSTNGSAGNFLLGSDSHCRATVAAGSLERGSSGGTSFHRNGRLRPVPPKCCRTDNHSHPAGRNPWFLATAWSTGTRRDESPGVRAEHSGRHRGLRHFLSGLEPPGVLWG